MRPKHLFLLAALVLVPVLACAIVLDILPPAQAADKDKDKTKDKLKDKAKDKDKDKDKDKAKDKLKDKTKDKDKDKDKDKAKDKDKEPDKTPSDREVGFTTIKINKELNGWYGNKDCWSVNEENHVLRFEPKKLEEGKSSTIYAENTHPSNAILKLQYRAKAGSDGGVLVHGKKFQIGDFEKLEKKDYAKAAKPFDEWNDLEFDITKGNAIVKLNGTVIAPSWAIGKASNKGIGLEVTTGEIDFKHIRQKEKDK